jgi:hypothetical protein
MKQRPVVRFFTLKGLSMRDIHTELEPLYMDEVLCLLMVYKRQERFIQKRTELFDDPPSGQPLQNGLGDALRVMIQEFPFSSCKRRWMHLRLGKGTCLGILQEVRRVQKFNLQWVAHSLSDAQRVERVSLSTDILRVLRENQKTGFASAITGDESCFYFEYLHQSVWVPSRDAVAERIKQKIDIERYRILDISSVNAIHSFADMLKWTAYNTTFFCDAFVPGLCRNIWARSKKLALKGILVHLDNTRPQNSRTSTECLTQFHARRVPYPAYSPDRAPSDFFLFGTTKTELQNSLAMSAIFEEMPKETLNSV